MASPHPVRASDRRRASVLRSVGWGAVLVLSTTACRRAPRPEPPAAPQVAPDRLGPHEAPPGSVELWGLSLPRGSSIERGFGDTAYVVVQLPPEQLIELLRAQAAEGPLEVQSTTNGAVFPHFRVHGTEPDRLLWVRVGGEGLSSSRLTVERVSVVPPPHALEHDEVMRKAGLTPDGRLLNPAQQE